MSRIITKKNGIIMKVTKLEPGIVFISQEHNNKLIVEQTIKIQFAFENNNSEVEDFKTKYFGKVVSGFNGLTGEEFESMNVVSLHDLAIYLRKFKLTIDEILNKKPLV